MTRPLQEIGLETARQLINFSGSQAVQAHVWNEQLEGAVAVYNILVQEKVAYLADEVGMGKTYVALGVVGLFRHFNPGWRVLYITPRENIQLKWYKEILNFTANNWLVTDNRVRSFQGTPAYGIAICHNLLDLTHKVTINPHRDFLTRMTSFSLPLPANKYEQWDKKRQALLQEIPWLDHKLFDLRDKEQFKDNYARAINTILPHFDLVLIDEGHNLKYGLQGSAARNRLIAQVLGHSDLADRRFPNYGRRFDRVLIISATPLESDYRELWNQLHLFDSNHNWSILNETESDAITDQAKQTTASRFLVRRLTGLTIGEKKYTKNMYRREWRNGGVSSHDHPLPVADERQRLIVALVQKKVSEVIGSERFKNSFQIGMLASFESFLETAKVADDSGNFDGSDQTNEQLEKEGVDTPSINRLAESYRREFGEALPHPKMDAVAESLKENFETGEKVLIFVRRVRSVDELAEKLNRYYDQWLKEHLISRSEKYPLIQQELDDAFQRYNDERLRRQPLSYVTPAEVDTEPDAQELMFKDVSDKGDNDNFFAWFFRGEGPSDVFSGASFNRNRLTSEGSAYATFFEDNYLTWLLDNPDDPIQTIAEMRHASVEETTQRLRQAAYSIFRQSSKQQRFPRLRVFWAYQQAALFLLEQVQDNDLAEKTRIIRRERYGGGPLVLLATPGNFPDPDHFLAAKTFFTELVKRAQLRVTLWPEESNNNFLTYFRRREQRRELLLAAARLGHPFIDLWLAAAHRLGTISAGVQERSEDRAEALINDYLDILENQQQNNQTHSAYTELVKVAINFDLILAVNFPSIRDEPLQRLPQIFGQALGRQTPVGGMWGGVNQSLVRQFRMPGYPLILITTDVLQEGEDLHTFCGQVIHYGISWTPSSMEQRTGRVDRIQSLTQRRLDNQPQANPHEKLQVYYPHLQETIERLQVERVYERMNRFIRLMHKSFAGEQLKDSQVDLTQEIVLQRRDIQPITEALETIFPVKEEWLHRNWPSVPIKAKEEMERILNHFNRMIDNLGKTFKMDIESEHAVGSFFATVFTLPDGRLAGPGPLPNTTRRQPFALFLRTATGDGRVLLRCVSPVGVVGRNDDQAIERICLAQQKLGFGKICAIDDVKLNTYDLTAEADILFHPMTTQPDEVVDLVTRTTRCADYMEYALLQGRDEPMDTFREELVEEPKRE